MFSAEAGINYNIQSLATLNVVFTVYLNVLRRAAQRIAEDVHIVILITCVTSPYAISGPHSATLLPHRQQPRMHVNILINTSPLIIHHIGQPKR
ncbi:hypothetical protein GGR55DRAFT_635972 [Xylaria sp. FL0064]|nr:hypothetical protein GGR55DRAFT_635972 [Xylaria sp. FL0064]